jgi:hypothetical protein
MVINLIDFQKKKIFIKIIKKISFIKQPIKFKEEIKSLFNKDKDLMIKINLLPKKMKKVLINIKKKKKTIIKD